MVQRYDHRPTLKLICRRERSASEVFSRTTQGAKRLRSPPRRSLLRLIVKTHLRLFIQHQRPGKAIGIAGPRHVHTDRQNTSDLLLQIEHIGRRAIELLRWGLLCIAIVISAPQPVDIEATGSVAIARSWRRQL